MAYPSQRGLPARFLLALVKTVLTAVVLLDEAVRPLYRPLARRLAELSIVARMEAAIARLPRLVILLVLAVPFAIAEPLKIVGLFMIGRGQIVAGLLVLVPAYLASFLLVERIYHAGRDKLLTYRWLAWSMALLTKVRDRALSWIGTSAAYRTAMRMRDAARAWWRGIGIKS